MPFYTRASPEGISVYKVFIPCKLIDSKESREKTILIENRHC